MPVALTTNALHRTQHQSQKGSAAAPRSSMAKLITKVGLAHSLDLEGQRAGLVAIAR